MGDSAIADGVGPARSRREVVVVGSGLGGLTAALRARALGHSVTLVTKGSVDESNSRYAQGGIAAAVFDDDSVALHVGDTIAAGAGLSVIEAVEALCSDGPQRIQDLVRWGVAFDGDEGGWSRGLEAAHSRARVLHAGGDATGAAIVRALVGTLETTGVTLHEHALVTDLLLSSTGDRRVVGVEVLLADGLRHRLRADAIVLATGGAGQMYEFTTNPLIATGDGLAAAWRAGARLDDLEFYQFHPTALAVPSRFLVSEAVRGEGAVLLDAGGRRFMAAVDRRAELAPRDIVARGIADLMKRQAGVPALLDATGIGAETLRSRFPTITAATTHAGLDWTTEPIPVTPAAHYFMGGVATDLWGRASLEGLYAVGEVASTGVHGANRLASNSLLEAAVFGWRAAEAIEADFTVRGDLRGGRGASAGDAVLPDAVFEPREQLSRVDLQRLMWSAAGVERTKDVLDDAFDRLSGRSRHGSYESDAVGVSDAVVSDAVVAAPSASTDGRHRIETHNLRQVATLVVEAALAREESRGAHYRSDFPQPSDEFRHSLSSTRKVFEHADR